MSGRMWQKMETIPSQWPAGMGKSARSATTVSMCTPRSAASRRALARPTGDPSTAVTDRPCSASQTALRPSPSARQSTRPAGMRSIIAARKSLAAVP